MYTAVWSYLPCSSAWAYRISSILRQDVLSSMISEAAVSRRALLRTMMTLTRSCSRRRAPSGEPFAMFRQLLDRACLRHCEQVVSKPGHYSSNSRIESSGFRFERYFRAQL